LQIRAPKGFQFKLRSFANPLRDTLPEPLTNRRSFRVEKQFDCVPLFSSSSVWSYVEATGFTIRERSDVRALVKIT